MMAIDEANAKGGVAGYKIVPVVYDSGTATAGQYDPAQAATNTKKLISDPQVVANVGPEMSGEGKAMTPILSEANLATITPSSTNPDITDPKMAGQFKPKGKAIYFRTVTTDAYQGPNMANYYARHAAGEVGLHPRRLRRLRRRHRQLLREAGRRRSASRSWAATSSTRRKPTTRPS